MHGDSAVWVVAAPVWVSAAASRISRVKFEIFRTIRLVKSASGRSNTAVLRSCGNTAALRPACRICLSVGNRRLISAPSHLSDTRLCATAKIANGLCATADLGWSFYSSFGGLTKKFRTNLAQKRRSSSCHSSLATLTKKFRTIAGQRSFATYPVFHTTNPASRGRRSFPDDEGRIISHQRPRHICLRQIRQRKFSVLRNHRPA